MNKRTQKLFEAIRNAETFDVDELLDLIRSADGSIHYDEDGYSSLHVAVGCNQFDIAELLIAEGVDVNAVDKNGHSVLHEASFMDSDFVEMLLKNEVDVTVVDKDGRTALDLAREFKNDKVVELLEPFFKK